MPLNETAVIREFVVKEMLCGSRVTCNPPVTGTDQDVLVLVKSINHREMSAVLSGAGWLLGGSGQADDEFESWTKGDVNLILVDDLDYYARHACATALCKRLNLLKKDERCLVFRAMLYTESPWVDPDFPGADYGSPF